MQQTFPEMARRQHTIKNWMDSESEKTEWEGSLKVSKGPNCVFCSQNKKLSPAARKQKCIIALPKKKIGWSSEYYILYKFMQQTFYQKILCRKILCSKLFRKKNYAWEKKAPQNVPTRVQVSLLSCQGWNILRSWMLRRHIILICERVPHTYFTVFQKFSPTAFKYIFFFGKAEVCC